MENEVHHQGSIYSLTQLGFGLICHWWALIGRENKLLDLSAYGFDQSAQSSDIPATRGIGDFSFA